MNYIKLIAQVKELADVWDSFKDDRQNFQSRGELFSELLTVTPEHTTMSVLIIKNVANDNESITKWFDDFEGFLSDYNNEIKDTVAVIVILRYLLKIREVGLSLNMPDFGMLITNFSPLLIEAFND